MLAGLALSLFGAPGAQAARSEFFGIAQGPPLDAADLQTLETTGVRTDRFLLHWKAAEPSRGQFNWLAADQMIGGLAAHGVRPVPFVWGSPSWARTGGSARPPVSSASARSAWTEFLKAAVTRYGPGGSYWSNGYHQQFGESATPLPVTSWQVWNEPNLRNEFFPGSTVAQAAQRYAQLVRISHDAIRSKDRKAQIVLAGIATQKDPRVYDFLERLYSEPGIKAKFDAVAQHPYASGVDKVRAAIQRVRSVMGAHGDRRTPLWLTELGWGSAPPDGTGINLGPAGQAQMLTRSIELVLSNRAAWNVQRLYWFHWRDPPPDSPYAGICIRCGSAGLLSYGRLPKPAFDAFLNFTADATPPVAGINRGPAEGGPTSDPTPSFSLRSSDAGSTFTCGIDGGSLKPCSSPYTTPRLADGPHSLSVQAIDAVGNESAIISRSFTVDTQAPAAPVISATVPDSPANDNAPEVKGSAEGGSTVKLYKAAGCKGAVAAAGPAARFASPGITVAVAGDTTTRLRATATDAAGNTSPCSATWAYVEDSSAPKTTITAGPSGPTTESTPSFSFASSEPGSTFKCRFDSQPFAPCSGPEATHTPSTPLSDGPHSFEVRAIDAASNADATPAKRTFSVNP